MDPAVWTAFALTQLTFALTPGPAVLLVVSQAMARGWGAGMAAAWGVQAGNAAYFLLSVAGVGAILVASPAAFTVIKLCGAAYLVWMGVLTLRDARRAAASPEPSPPPLWRHPFVQGAAKQLGNPKSVVFFGALLPQFVGPGEASIRTFALLGLTCVAVEIPVLAFYAWLAARGRRLAAGPGWALWRERLSGIALIAVGGAVSTVAVG